MIKKSILVLLAAFFLLCNAAIAHAQKIYLFTGGDIHDPIIGKAAREDIMMFTRLFSYLESDKQVVEYNRSTSWIGPDIYYSNNVKEAVLTAIRKCPATSSDKIVFYWSGHGAYNRNGHYLYMPKGSVPPVMFRDEIMNALKNKGASLTVLITDSCYKYQETPKMAFAPERYVIKWKGIPPLFRSLFFNCSGVVNINSSRCNEISYCTCNGSLFTTNFVKCALSNLNNKMDWRSFLIEEVQKSIREDRFSVLNVESQPDQSNINIVQNIDDFDEGLPPLSEFPSKSWKILKHESNFDKPSLYIPMFAPLYFPKKGDRIISVDGIEIQNAAHFNQIICDDKQEGVSFTLIDHRTGKKMKCLVKDKNPSGSSARLGYIVQDDQRGGVMVTDVPSGMPGERCYVLKKSSSLDD